MKKITQDAFDEKLRQEMQASVHHLAPSAYCKETIENRLQETRKEKGRWMMKNKRVPKIAAAVFVCALLISGGLYAAGNIVSILSVSSADYDYTDYQDIDKAKEKAGVDAVIPETLGEGYTFEGVRLIEVSDVDEDNNKLNKRFELNATYVKDKSDRIELFAETSGMSAEDTKHYQEKKDIAGTTVYYAVIDNLFLPPNEKPTVEEQARADNDPFFNIAYGSNTREESQSSQIIFAKAGIKYCVFVEENALSAEEMFDLAAVILA